MPGKRAGWTCFQRIVVTLQFTDFAGITCESVEHQAIIST